MSTRKNILLVVVTLLHLANPTAALWAQQVSVPDPGLNAAIRQVVQKPTGPLTEQDMLGLTALDAGARSITNLQGLDSARNLLFLDLSSNHLANLVFPNTLGKLRTLDLSFNPLTNCVFSNGLTELNSLIIENSQLTNLTIPPELRNLVTLDLDGNQLTDLTLPTGLTSLTFLQVSGNQLTSLALPSDATNVATLFVDGNPLTTLVLSDIVAARVFGSTVSVLQNEGLSIFVYPLTTELLRPGGTVSAFGFSVAGPPGIYAILQSTNFIDWVEVGVVTNSLGSASFTDSTVQSSSHRFYRARKE